MSDRKIQLRIVTPDKTVVDMPVEAVGAMGSEGVTDLKPGLLWFRAEGQNKDMAVSGGFIEILPDKAVVLADSAEYLEEIDVERAERALKRAQDRLATAKATMAEASEGLKTDVTRATASFNRAANRIKMAARRSRA